MTFQYLLDLLFMALSISGIEKLSDDWSRLKLAKLASSPQKNFFSKPVARTEKTGDKHTEAPMPISKDITHKSSQ